MLIVKTWKPQLHISDLDKKSAYFFVLHSSEASEHIMIFVYLFTFSTVQAIDSSRERMTH
jgi:hypothetical protein